MPRVWLAFVRLPDQSQPARAILASATSRDDAARRVGRIVADYWGERRGWRVAAFDAGLSLRLARVRVLA